MTKAAKAPRLGLLPRTTSMAQGPLGVSDGAGRHQRAFPILMTRLDEEEPDGWYYRGSDGPQLASYQVHLRT